MKLAKSNLFIPLVLILVISTSLSGCLSEDFELDGVEIEEYQGKDLSSIYDFRENSISGPQNIPIENYTLSITGLVEQEISLSYDELVNDFTSYKKVVTLNCVEGWSVKILWEGFLLEDVLALANVSEDAELVIFHAYDGYSTSLRWDFIQKKDIIVAYRMNNVTLPAERGYPFQLVAESKWGYKWIKWITEIEVSDNILFKGYWERRGYSNNASVNKYFFEE